MPQITTELCQSKHSALSARTDKLESSFENVQNRLPAWATLVISVLTMAMGALIRGVL